MFRGTHRVDWVQGCEARPVRGFVGGGAGAATRGGSRSSRQSDSRPRRRVLAVLAGLAAVEWCSSGFCGITAGARAAQEVTLE